VGDRCQDLGRAKTKGRTRSPDRLATWRVLVCSAKTFSLLLIQVSMYDWTPNFRSLEIADAYLGT
jgi:hypothetical protein